MSKRTHTKRRSKRKNQEDWPLVVYAWIGGLLFTGYLGAEIAIAQNPHPLHWLTALLGGVMGYFVGQVWYRWRGDIV